MDLRTFISETLQQIVGGVDDAQAAIREMGNGAQVNPTMRRDGSSRRGADPSPVEFDIAVTVVNSTVEGETGKISGSAGILAVVGMKVGASAEGRNEAQRRDDAVSRVKFKVDLAQPGDVTVLPSRSASIPSQRTGWND